MTDEHNSLSWTDSELAHIAALLETSDPWDHTPDSIKVAKTKAEEHKAKVKERTKLKEYGQETRAERKALTSEIKALWAEITALRTKGNAFTSQTDAIKDKLRDFHRSRQQNGCCYCRRSLVGEATVSIDREHVLPKKKFKTLTFEVENISVACKRCNMPMKGDDTSFVIDIDRMPDDFRVSDLYEIVHPNLDTWEQHLARASLELNSVRLVFYEIVEDSPKGHATYNYFNLHELETNSFDESQGMSIEDGFDEMRAKIAQIAQRFGQK